MKTIQAESSNVHTNKGDAYSLVSFSSKMTEHSYAAQQRPVMTSDEVYRLDPNKCIIMVSGYKPIIDYKIDLDNCLNYGSDLFSDVVGYMPKRDKNGVEIPGTEDKTKPIRKLKEVFIYPITGANSRKMTADSFREGLSYTSEIDRQQAEERFKDMAEEQKYGYGEDVPDAEPEIHDTAEPDIINRSDPEKVEIKAFHLSVTEKLDEIVAEKVKKPEAYHFDEPEEKHDISEKSEESDRHESVESTDDESAEIVKEDSESVVGTDPIESDEQPENEAEEHAGVSEEVPCPAEDSVETVETAEVAETEDADETDSAEDEESDENSDDMEAVDDPSDIEFDESEVEDEDSLNDQLSEALSDYLM